MPQTKATAKRTQLSFDDWLPLVTPNYDWTWKHLIYARQHLDKITTGKIKKLMIFMPPRHGKTDQDTIRYPVWRLAKDPSIRVVIAAYNQKLANKFSRMARKIAAERIVLSDDRTAVEEWETTEGGGIRAVGVGSGITGMGADLIVIDDPVKSREEANSLSYQERLYDWYTDDLFTRLEPDGAIVLTMTRWHEADLAGRILDSEDGSNWTVLSLPALAGVEDPIHRQEGEALCPQRYDRQSLLSIKRTMGTRSFSALYQQTPQEQEGEMIKRSWFNYYQKLPVIITAVRYWDKGATDNDGDYTVGFLLGLGPDENYYGIDIVRGQWSTHTRNQKILEAAKADRARFGHIKTYVEQEPGSSGKDSVDQIVRLLSEYSVRGDKVTGDKVIRADGFAAALEAGRIYLPKHVPWLEEYISELTSFPNGKHDDQVDATSGAYNKLVGDNYQEETFENPFY